MHAHKVWNLSPLTHIPPSLPPSLPPTHGTFRDGHGVDVMRGDRVGHGRLA